MTDQLITFETSALAIKKGFDRWKVQEPIQIPVEGSSQCDEHWPPVTQALLQRWLREVHNLHSSLYSTAASMSNGMEWGMSIYPVNGLRFYDTNGNDVVQKNSNTQNLVHNSFNSYEEALEESLRIMLNTLPDVETETTI